MNLRTGPWLVAVLVALAVAAHAEAQSGAGRLLDEGGTTTVSAALSTYGGYDRSDLRTRTPLAGTDRAGSGVSVGATGILSLATRLSRVSLNAAGSSDVRYFASLGALSGITGQSSSGSVRLSGPVGRKATMHVSQSFGTSSFYHYNPFAGMGPGIESDPTLATADYRIDRGRTLTYSLGTGSELRVGRYTSLSFDYRLHWVRFPSELLSYRRQGAGGRLQRRIARHASLIAGYGYDFGGAAREVSTAGYHHIDLGVSYAAPLPFSRLTTVSATTGAAVVTTAEPGRGVRHGTPQLTLTAGVARQVGRAWTTGVEYRRQPQLNELFSVPSYANMVTGSVRGRLGRRAAVVMAAGYSRATIAGTAGDVANETMFGSMRVSLAAGRRVSTYAEYGYYDFDSAVTRLSRREFSRFGRHTVRGGLTWALPVIAPRQP